MTKDDVLVVVVLVEEVRMDVVVELMVLDENAGVVVVEVVVETKV